MSKPKLKFGVEMPQHLGFAHLKEMALATEKLGYDSIWVRDHLIINPDEIVRFPMQYIEGGQGKASRSFLGCIPTLSALCAVTSRITLGTDIINLPRRNPVDVANEMATVDQISGGRFIFQAAVGQPYRDWEPLGITTPLSVRGKMMEEGLTLIKELWTHEEPITFKGEYYTVIDGRIGSRPVQKPHPPIWLGVEKTFKRVAKFASGFTLTHTMWGGDLEFYRTSVEKIREEARKIGRNPDDIEAGARFAIAIGTDRSKAKKRAVEDWTKVRCHNHRPPGQDPWYGEWAGDADDIMDLINPYIDAGARHIMIWPIPYASFPECMEDITAFAETVIPRYKD